VPELDFKYPHSISKLLSLFVAVGYRCPTDLTPSSFPLHEGNTPHIFRPHADIDRSRRWDSTATTTARTGFTILAAFALAIGAGFFAFRTPLGTPFCTVHWFSFLVQRKWISLQFPECLPDVYKRQPMTLRPKYRSLGRTLSGHMLFAKGEGRGIARY